MLIQRFKPTKKTAEKEDKMDFYRLGIGPKPTESKKKNKKKDLM